MNDHCRHCGDFCIWPNCKTNQGSNSDSEDCSPIKAKNAIDREYTDKDKSLEGIVRRLRHMQEDLPPEFQKIVDNHFWDLLS